MHSFNFATVWEVYNKKEYEKVLVCLEFQLESKQCLLCTRQQYFNKRKSFEAETTSSLVSLMSLAVLWNHWNGWLLSSLRKRPRRYLCGAVQLTK
jgi:hypothetical protein